ncbi:MAG: nitronate monooxygenase [Myxococcales bacterium]|nr:nitronate monooxygenase [Myxococcales bacterium]
MSRATTPNRVCSLLGIEYPLLMGAITPEPELGALVTKAGGLGCIEGIAAPETLRDQIRRFRKLSDGPFSVNFPIAFGSADTVQARARVAIEERVPVVITSAGSPRLFTELFKEHGILVGHVVAELAHARKAAESGVDVLIAEPTESGGYRGANEISMMVLIPAIARALPQVPLVAAGTVVDRAGMVAVTALGAEGVWLGTRLIATEEGRASFGEHYHELILAADDTSTMSSTGKTRPRVTRPEFVESVLGTRTKRVQMGQAAALIDHIPTLAEVFDELFAGAHTHAKDVAARLDFGS